MGDLVVSVHSIVADTPTSLAKGLTDEGISQSGELVVMKAREGEGRIGIRSRVVTFFL